MYEIKHSRIMQTHSSSSSSRSLKRAWFSQSDEPRSQRQRTQFERDSHEVAKFHVQVKEENKIILSQRLASGATCFVDAPPAASDDQETNLMDAERDVTPFVEARACTEAPSRDECLQAPWTHGMLNTRADRSVVSAPHKFDAPVISHQHPLLDI